MVARTVAALTARIQGSMCMGSNTKHQTPNTKEAPNPKHKKHHQCTAIWSLILGVCLVFGVWCLVFLPDHLRHFLLLQRNGSSDENPRDGPNRREEADPKSEPRQREAEDTRRHKLRPEV